MFTKPISNRHALAIDHVARGRVVIARQQKLIREIRDRQGDCSSAEDLLATFERSMAIFEDDLREIEKREARTAVRQLPRDSL